MVIVDTALERRHSEGRPIQVAIFGAGAIGKGTALQIMTAFQRGMRVAVIVNRTLAHAASAYHEAGADKVQTVTSSRELDEAIRNNRFAITDDPLVACGAEGIDVVIEATGAIDYAALVTLSAIENGKHVVLMNAELDATVGPILKVYADKAGVVLTNADGDQPGVVMNLFRWVKQLGYRPVLAGNIKGMQDHYRTPETQRAFAEANKQSPTMVTSFADGTKISMEMAVVANGTGFGVGQRGMYGPRCEHVTEAPGLFPLDVLLEGGIVDYVLGAEPSPGVFVLGYNEDPTMMHHMRYFKMGDGPLYTFYVPYHLPHLEVPLTAARAVLFQDAAVAPIGGPVCEVITTAKRDLKAGETLDGIGGFMTYGDLENSAVVVRDNLLPMGVSEGCRLIREVAKDDVLSYDDVEMPQERLSDRLMSEMRQAFSLVPT